MTDLTLFDYIYVVVTFGSILWAFIRGGVYELVATFSWLAAALASRFVSPWLNEVFQKWFHLSEPTIGTLVASYFLIFFGTLVVFGFFNQRLRDFVQSSILNVTDRTLGIIFGILRAIVIMGLLYWTMLWYYEDATKPSFLTDARTRPIMQVTAIKLHEWFIPGKNELLEKDSTSKAEAEELYNNIINPAIKAASTAPNIESTATDKNNEGIGYKESERNSLENQLLQLDNAPATSD